MYDQDDRNARILVVDDNPAIHEDFKKILARNAQDPDLDLLEKELFGASEKVNESLPAYEIDSAMQGEEAVEMVAKAQSLNQPYSVAFVDMRMPPGIDGIHTIELLWQRAPTLQIVICTAYSDYSWTETLKRLGCTDRLLILKKPFDKVEVCQLALALSVKFRLETVARTTMQQLREMVRLRTAEIEKELELRRKVESAFHNSHQSLQQQTEFDSVTGLLNRDAVLENLDRIIAQSQITKEAFSLLLISINQFFEVQQELGPMVASEVARIVSKIFRGILRPSDCLGRLDDDQMFAVLRGCSQSDAYLVAERLRIEIAGEPLKVDGHSISSTISIALTSSDELENPSTDVMLSDLQNMISIENPDVQNRVITKRVGQSPTTMLTTDSLKVSVEDFTTNY